MATKVSERDKSEAGSPEAPPSTDSPLLDLTDQAVKRMIKLAKKRGYVTYDELNEVLPSEEFSSEQIEDVLGQLSEQGINVVDNEDPEAAGEERAARGKEGEEDEAEGGDLVEAQRSALPVETKRNLEPTERTDDPVRMYLREMGSVELLSREGEIAIAKRIEAGREAMIAGLCESPLTFQAIIIWRDELIEGKVLLRDIIDLEATYAGPDGKNPEQMPGEGEEGEGGEEARAFGAEGEPPPDGDDDDIENNVSLSAMEAELKPRVLETFDSIASNYTKLRRLQDQDIANRLENTKLSPAQDRKYKKLKDDIITAVKSLSLNNNRIEALVEQLYDINKRLISHETRLLRLAESYGVAARTS
jgi:RNA polymerase primary sigma factor